MTDLIVRAFRALLAWLWPPYPDMPEYVRPADRAPLPALPRHRSPYAAEAAAEAEADRTGAARRYPPPGPRTYAPAVYHVPRRPEPQTSAAKRLTQGRRRAELWLATVNVDPRGLFVLTASRSERGHETGARRQTPGLRASAAETPEVGSGRRVWVGLDHTSDGGRALAEFPLRAGDAGVLGAGGAGVAGVGVECKPGGGRVSRPGSGVGLPPAGAVPGWLPRCAVRGALNK
jgi:hypothetical protein